jgi:hypothetical protein
LPKLITFEPPPWTWFIRKIQKPKRRTNGRRPVSRDHQADVPVPFESNVTSCSLIRVVRPVADWSLG